MCLTYDLTVEIRRQCWVLVCQTLDFQISAQEGIFKIDVLKKGPITITRIIQQVLYGMEVQTEGTRVYVNTMGMLGQSNFFMFCPGTE